MIPSKQKENRLFKDMFISGDNIYIISSFYKVELDLTNQSLL
jgi:hypothetical protein